MLLLGELVFRDMLVKTVDESPLMVLNCANAFVVRSKAGTDLNGGIHQNSVAPNLLILKRIDPVASRFHYLAPPPESGSRHLLAAAQRRQLRILGTDLKRDSVPNQGIVSAFASLLRTVDPETAKPSEQPTPRREIPEGLIFDYDLRSFAVHDLARPASRRVWLTDRSCHYPNRRRPASPGPG